MNLGLEEVSVVGNTMVGGLAGYLGDGGRIANSFARGSVEGTSNVGGLVGKNRVGSFPPEDSEIVDSYANVDVVGEEFVGGLIGGSVGREERRFDRKARNSLFNFNVGFAQGGSISTTGGSRSPGSNIRRPAGLDSRDIVPIWTQPGEWIIRKDSSLKYGSRIMRAINNGLIDPMALATLAGVRPSVTRRSSRGVGFQTGGQVAGARTIASTAAVPQPRVVAAVVVPDERNMERMLSGGGQAMLEWLSDNAPAVKGVLS